MVGASYSSVTKPLSKATLAMRLPLISYAATNRDLSRHKGGHTHTHTHTLDMSRMTALLLQMFARTVWSDDVLAQTIADLILHFRLVSLKTLGTRGSRN